MKKIIYLIITIVIIIAVLIFYQIYNRNIFIYNAKKANEEYIQYTDIPIQGTQLITLINKAINQNEENGVLKDENEFFVNNNSNSIQIEIKLNESDHIFKMESIAKSGVEKFITLYSNQYFKCIETKYHNNNNICYLFFEEQK